MPSQHDASENISADEFSALFRNLKRWGRWGERDERGALHYLTAERTALAGWSRARWSERHTEPTIEY